MFVHQALPSPDRRVSKMWLDKEEKEILCGHAFTAKSVSKSLDSIPEGLQITRSAHDEYWYPVQQLKIWLGKEENELFCDDDSSFTTTAPTSLAGIFGGLQVTPSTDIPDDFQVQEFNFHFPSHWAPSKIHTYPEAFILKARLYNELKEFGLSKTESKFEHADIHTFGGRALLQPGSTTIWSYIIHQFITLYALWEDFVKGTGERGIESMERLAKIANAIKNEDTLLSVRLVYESDDEMDQNFMRWWKFHFETIRAHCDDRRMTARYFEQVEELCASLVEETCFLDALDLTEQGIREHWLNQIGTVGGNVLFELFLLSNDYKPNDEVYTELKGLEFLYSKIIREINEIASIPMDIAEECVSLFASEMILGGLTVDETIQLFLDHNSKTIEAFDALANSLKLKFWATEPKLALFIDCLRVSSIGFADWHTQGSKKGENPKRYNMLSVVDPELQVVKHFGVKVGRTTE